MVRPGWRCRSPTRSLLAKTCSVWECARKARVLYVDGELPGELLQQRIDQLGPALPATDLLWLTQAQFGARGQEMIDLGTPKARDYLDRWIEEHEIELIVLGLGNHPSALRRRQRRRSPWRAIQTWSLRHRGARALGHLPAPPRAFG